MKNTQILCVIMLAFALSGIVRAQDCGYYAMSQGTVFGYKNMDAKGKVTGNTLTTCLEVKKVGTSVVYKVSSETSDANNKNPNKNEYEMRCEAGKFFVDMKNLVDSKTMEGFKNMEVKVEGTDMMYPATLAAGQSLPDANVTISAGSGGVTIMNMVIKIINRKVVGNEMVTVPAGTFECYKITYDVETKMMMKINSSVTEYINMGAGIIKTETFDSKGKIAGSTILTELKK